MDAFALELDRPKQDMKRSLLVEGYGIPLGGVPAPADRNDSPLLGSTLDKLDDLGHCPTRSLPDEITVSNLARRAWTTHVTNLRDL
ncbi:hypothetical protein [Actinomadura rugatobispora]|uniref:Uncharacterized protein n=1 Tax=Actinomadura rugatobispora TaxID=1994 RepID=A0ABW0ZUA5_9ACTN|nr:hypothetical protein GCM10010200_076280 [Actinomadura rugatobispora]